MEAARKTPLLSGDDGERFHFAHSYHLNCRHSEDIVATASHGLDFPAIIQREHIIGVQFHPEKSHRYGKQLLAAFCQDG